MRLISITLVPPLGKICLSACLSLSNCSHSRSDRARQYRYQFFQNISSTKTNIVADNYLSIGKRLRIYSQMLGTEIFTKPFLDVLRISPLRLRIRSGEKKNESWSIFMRERRWKCPDLGDPDPQPCCYYQVWLKSITAGMYKIPWWCDPKDFSRPAQLLSETLLTQIALDNTNNYFNLCPEQSF